MSYRLRVTGLDSARRRLGGNFGPMIQTGTEAVAIAIEGEIAPAPGPVKYPIQWESAKERKAYFALRKGRLPYVRESDFMSQQMLKGWVIEKWQQLGAILRNTASYSRYVSGSIQKPYHRNTGWVTAKQAVDKVIESGEASRLILEAIRVALRRR